MINENLIVNNLSIYSRMINGPDLISFRIFPVQGHSVLIGYIKQVRLETIFNLSWKIISWKFGKNYIESFLIIILNFYVKSTIQYWQNRKDFLVRQNITYTNTITDLWNEWISLRLICPQSCSSAPVYS